MTAAQIKTFRRDLSGIYIFDTLPQDEGSRKPTCIEDCSEKTQYEWIYKNARDPEHGDKFIKNLCQYLNETMSLLRAMFTEEEKEKYDGIMKYVDVSYTIFTSVESKVREIMRFCKAIKLLAMATGISAPRSEFAIAAITEDEDGGQ